MTYIQSYSFPSFSSMFLVDDIHSSFQPAAPSNSRQQATAYVCLLCHDFCRPVSSSRFNQVFTFREYMLLDLLLSIPARASRLPESHTLCAGLDRVAHACVQPFCRYVTAGWSRMDSVPLCKLKCLLFSMCSHCECSWAHKRLC